MAINRNKIGSARAIKRTGRVRHRGHTYHYDRAGRLYRDNGDFLGWADPYEDVREAIDRLRDGKPMRVPRHNPQPKTRQFGRILSWRTLRSMRRRQERAK